MKYIRTKDTEFRIGEILKVLEEDDDYFECKGTFEERMGCKAFVKKEIVIKLANTVEELCDEFVLIEDNEKTIFINHNKFLQHRGDNYYSFNLEQVRRKEIEINGTLYGAIWTDKGLIYVAKMNSEGKLCLI